jgi:hypothetical protein
LKKIFAIAMLALLLFNIWGYQLLFEYFIYQSDNSITEQINNNRYKPTDLVEVKIPVHLNIQDWDDFKPITGRIKVKETCYNYAELKMTRDTLYLMCISNNDKARLIKAGVIYAKAVNDVLPVSKKGHDQSTKKENTLSEYNLLTFNYKYSAYATAIKQSNCVITLSLDNPFIESPVKPPNFIS